MAMIARDLVDKQLKPATHTPVLYQAIRALFFIVSEVFFKHIEVEGLDNLAPDGIPCILCANHSNSLTDPTLLISHVPSKKRRLLRLTAKDAHFRRRNLSSWLIEHAGTLPIMRAKDHAGVAVEPENTRTFARLVEALAQGDVITLFPEGISRYFPTIAPLKTGAARIASQFISAHPDNDLQIVTASITYTQRERFRSNVLISFGPPIHISAHLRPELILSTVAPTENDKARCNKAIRQLTNEVEDSIRKRCLDAPSWKILRTAQTARRLYAPASSARQMSLGSHIRLTQAWVDIFSKLDKQDLDADNGLANRLRTYHKHCQTLGLKDYRVMLHTQLPTLVLVRRLIIRFCIACATGVVASPAVVAWVPTLLFVKYQESAFKRAGRNKKQPKWDVWDEIAQTKLVYGLLSLLATWLVLVLATLPMSWFTIWAIPLWMLFGLRAYEKFISSLRGFIALSRLLFLHNAGVGRGLLDIMEERENLKREVIALAKQNQLPEAWQVWLDRDAPNGRARPKLSQLASSGSTRDWQRSLRLWDSLDSDSDDEEGTSLFGLDMSKRDCRADRVVKFRPV